MDNSRNGQRKNKESASRGAKPDSKPIPPLSDDGLSGSSLQPPRRREVETTESAVTSLQLVGNQQLTVEKCEHHNLIRIYGAQGRVSLTIEVTETGPVLRFDGADVAIETTGALSVDAETISLHGRQGVTVSSGGNAAIQVTGDLETSARIQNIRAELGNVNVTANDNIRLVGERVLLNC
jgi:hypothetical protein